MVEMAAGDDGGLLFDGDGKSSSCCFCSYSIHPGWSRRNIHLCCPTCAAVLVPTILEIVMLEAGPTCCKASKNRAFSCLDQCLDGGSWDASKSC